MKQIIFLTILLISPNILLAQEGDVIIGFSIGTNFSNLLNSEAPHKINFYGSDKNPPVIISKDIANSLAYFDYKTSLIKDIKPGLSIGGGFEYFLQNDLSVLLSFQYDAKGIDLQNSKFKSAVIDTSRYFSPAPPSNIAYYNEIYEVRISNKYLSVPLLIRKYILQRRF